MYGTILSERETEQSKRGSFPGDLSFVELQPRVQHYAWGDLAFIPELLGERNLQRRPYAELWIGAHPDAPSLGLVGSSAVPLCDLIQAAGSTILHASVSARFGGELPFLLKILSAASPLSLQVHPTKERAKIGFACEDLAGVPRNSSTRNYRDPNHKPELIVALTPFHALRGFRPLPDLVQQVARVPELQLLALDFQPNLDSLRELYCRLMNLHQADVNLLASSMLERINNDSAARQFNKADPEYWILRASRIYSKDGHHDRGLFSFYLMNIISLNPGDALFLPAGILHAYLEGAGVEVMASSNNVLRGGLTPKHIDVKELLSNLVFDCEHPRVIHAQPDQDGRRWTYPTPATEFELSRIEMDLDKPFQGTPSPTVELFVVESCATNDFVTVDTVAGTKLVKRGQAFLISANQAFELHANGPARIFSARVPQPIVVESRSAEKMNRTFRQKTVTPLAFGTSGLRGLVQDITDLEAYINTRGFLQYLAESGNAHLGDPVGIGCDLRPSSWGTDRSIIRAVAAAIADAGFLVDLGGRIPTPALTLHGLQRQHPSIMVTGSHIPFDRNGIKFNKTGGEVLKSDEAGILKSVERIRDLEYRRDPRDSQFRDDGMFREPPAALPDPNPTARRNYIRRYLDFFPSDCLKGLRLLAYEHSAVGRDVLVEILRRLGAEVVTAGRSETFVPIDTEALSPGTLASLQAMADKAGRIDAIVSTDGDSDRPLLCGVSPSGAVRFIGGDLLGIVVSRYLRADVLAVPISANDAVDRCAAANGTKVIKTKIGSPYVIAAMETATAAGAKRVVGWEANGGFLVGSDIELDGRVLKALPTRDALLPILAALCSARALGVTLHERFQQLPARVSRAGLIDNFPPDNAQAILRKIRPADSSIQEVSFRECSVRATYADGRTEVPNGEALENILHIRSLIEHWFSPAKGFDQLCRINTLDGVRLQFRNGDIVHVRPSGNAPQLRIYAVANTEERVEAILAMNLQSSGGIQDLASEPEVPADPFCEAIRKNIALNEQLLVRGETPEVIGTVSGSAAAQNFWQELLEEARGSFRARAALSFHEDLPTNQAFGILLLWQRLKPNIQEDRGALVAFVFGDGTRSTPFTETDNAQKPAIATFAKASTEPGSRYLTMVELAMRHFVPVQQYLRRSGFNGLVVKWGDEVQIPTRDLSGSDELFKDADIVRFVSIREMNEDEAKNKDWVGVDEHGRVTAFIPRRPLAEMEQLAELGLVQRRDGKLYGGINLGSIALSSVLLDCLLEEFGSEVNDPAANRKERPALDPEFFTALTVAAITSPNASFAAWQRAVRESADVAALAKRIPNILDRLRTVIHRLQERTGRMFKMAALDFGDQYWGDVGQHAKIREFYMALNDGGRGGEVARALAGLSSARDAHGNIIVDSLVSEKISVSNSVLIGVNLTGEGSIHNSVLVGTRASNVQIENGFDVLSTSRTLCIESNGGTYKTVSLEPVHAAQDEHLTTLFLPEIGPALFRVRQNTDLRDKAGTYAVPILGNPLSFQQAHDQMGQLTVEKLRRARSTAEEKVLANLAVPGNAQNQ